MNDNLKETLGMRLKMWRKHLKLKQVEFANLTHVHVGMIRKYEGNVSVPGGEMLIEFAKTGLDIHWLLMGIGEMCRINGSNEKNETIIQMLEGLDEEKQELLLCEFRSRAQDAKKLNEITVALKLLLSKPNNLS